MKLEFHPAAEQELIEAAAYYEDQVPGLGWRFEAEIRHAVDLLLRRPMIGAEADAVLRKFVLVRFPYTLYYSVRTTCCALKSWRISADALVTGAIGDG